MASSIVRSVAAVAALAGLVGGTCLAVAQPAGPGYGRGPGPGMMRGGPGTMGAGPGMMGGGPGARGNGPGMMGGIWTTGSYFDALKTRLAITDQQLPAWKEYADTVGGVSEQMQGLHQTMFDAMGTATWQERRDMMNRMFQARQQASDTVHAAAQKLLPALDAKQKAIAEQSLPGLAYGPGRMGARGPRGPRWQQR